MTEPTYDSDDIRISELMAAGLSRSQAIGIVMREAREAEQDQEMSLDLSPEDWSHNLVAIAKTHLHESSPFGALVFPDYQPF